MVCLHPQFAEHQAARRMIVSMGVPADVVEATETAHPDVAWRDILRSLDGVFMSRGGSMGQMWFMRERHAELQGRTPVEALPGPDGPLKIRLAARAFTNRAAVRR